jgi:hypothetical protein
MSFSSKSIALGLVFGLIVGCVIGYSFSPKTDLAPYLQQIDDLEEQISDLQEEYDQILLNYQELNESYNLLLNTLNIIDAKNYSRTVELFLIVGETQRYEYDVGYGILWIIELSLKSDTAGTRYTCMISWRQGEQGGVVSGGGITISHAYNSINGTISTEIYDEGNSLFISSYVDTNVSEFDWDGSGRIPKNP